jgi:DNA-binding CsgD family transcriptional regulator/N-acetylneuraminic acid mutarotase
MPELGEPLSDRELDVLRGLADGAANKDIADDLSISPYTVKTHLRNIYTKLGVSTRTEALTVAMQQGLLVVPGVPGSAEQTLAPPPPAAPEAITRPAPSHRWRNISLLLVVVLLLAAGLLFVQWRTGGLTPSSDPLFEEQPIGDSRWLTSRPMPEPRTGQAVAAVGLDVYVIGGRTEGGIIDDVRVFDSRERTWRRAAAKPTAVTRATADELFGEIYVVGGLRADGQPTDIVEAYSPSQNAWRRVASLPQPLAGGLVVAEGGYLYVFGGWNGETALNTAYLYDPGADSWRPLARLPEPRTDAAGDSLTGQIYLVGGSDGSAGQSTCFAYNPTTGTWSDCPSMLEARAAAGATVLLNKLYVIGGMDPVAPGAALGELFDPNTGTWTVLNLPPGSVPWLEPGVAHVENRIYAMGGQQANELSDANLVYSPFVFQTFIPAASSDTEE